MRTKASLFSFLVGVFFWTSVSADSYVEREDASEIRIWITGQISQQDAAFFSGRLKELQTKTLEILLDSPGGDADAAMKIGRIVRSVDGWTYITVPSRCYSSCSLIFIAGVNRSNYGELGLHRPYLASAPLSREQIEKQVPIMRATMKKYVEEMGITDSFFERMFNTDPSAIQILRGDQSEKLVPHRDPTYDEIVTSHSARRYGLTTAEYRRRDTLADSCQITTKNYQYNKNYPDCYEPIMWGLSLDLYRSRSAIAKVRCGAYTDSERQILNDTPKKDRNSLPFVVRLTACKADTMAGK